MEPKKVKNLYLVTYGYKGDLSHYTTVVEASGAKEALVLFWADWQRDYKEQPIDTVDPFEVDRIEVRPIAKGPVVRG